MTTDDIKGTMECPICGTASPHPHSREEIARYLVAQGNRFGYAFRVFSDDTKTPLAEKLEQMQEQYVSAYGRECYDLDYCLDCLAVETSELAALRARLAELERENKRLEELVNDFAKQAYDTAPAVELSAARLEEIVKFATGEGN